MQYVSFYLAFSFAMLLFTTCSLAYTELVVLRSISLFIWAVQALIIIIMMNASVLYGLCSLFVTIFLAIFYYMSIVEQKMTIIKFLNMRLWCSLLLNFCFVLIYINNIISPHPKYQFVRLKSQLQCGSLSTSKNAHLEILQDGWTTHAVAEAPAPLWTIPPERFIDLHPRLTNLTPKMIQTLGQGTTIDTTINIMSIITKKMKPVGSGEASCQRWRGVDCKIHLFNPEHT